MQLPCLGEVSATLCLFQFGAGGVERGLDLGFACNLVLLAHPAGGELGGLLFQVRQIAFQRFQPVL